MNVGQSFPQASLGDPCKYKYPVASQISLHRVTLE